MKLLEEQKDGMNEALNEADLLGFEVHPDKRVGAATFRVLTLDESGEVPQNSRLQFLFYPVTRIVASLRTGRWDDANAEVMPLALDELLQVVQSFSGSPVYGWQFFDVHEKTLDTIADRISLNWQSGENADGHSIMLFQEEGDDRFLELCVWFGSLLIRTPAREAVSIDDFIAGGRRWWDAMYAGDPRTEGRGITPAPSPHPPGTYCRWSG